MSFISIAGIYLNLDHIAFVRPEEHPHLGEVVAVHLSQPERDPLYLNSDHLEEMGRMLLQPHSPESTPAADRTAEGAPSSGGTGPGRSTQAGGISPV